MEVKEEVSVKKKRNWLFTLFACIMTGVIVFLAMSLGQNASKVIDPNTKGTSDNKEEIVESNSNENTETTVANSYEVYAKKVKENFSKLDSTKQISQSVTTSVINQGYSVSLDENGTLTVTYYDTELNKKFNNYKIEDNVLSFYVINGGQGGGNYLYFIYEDGTVGVADTEYGVSNNGTINVTKETEYKDIVTILNGSFGQVSGTSDAIFVDINGNFYSKNLN